MGAKDTTRRTVNRRMTVALVKGAVRATPARDAAALEHWRRWRDQLLGEAEGQEHGQDAPQPPVGG